MKPFPQKSLMILGFFFYWIFTCWFIGLPLTMEIAYELGDPAAYIPLLLPVCFCLLFVEWYVVALLKNRKHVVLSLTLGTMVFGGMLWGYVLTRPTKKNRNIEMQSGKDVRPCYFARKPTIMVQS
jgi:hypothetical protein